MWANPQETVGLVTFTEEILTGKPYFLCSVSQILVKQEIWRILKNLETIPKVT